MSRLWGIQIDGHPFCFPRGVKSQKSVDGEALDTLKVTRPTPRERKAVKVNKNPQKPGKKAAVAVEMLPMLAEEAKERQRKAGKDHSCNLKNQDCRVEPNLEQADNDTPSRANEIAAKAVGVGKTTVAQMKAITEANPELAEQVKKGERITEAGQN